MGKKLVIAAAALLVGLAVVKMTTVGSLVQVWWHDAGKFIDKQVPPETRIKQLKIEVNKIDGDIKAAVNNLVRLEVAHDELKKDVDGLKVKQEARRKDMATLIEGLEQVSTRIAFKGQNFSHEVAQLKLDGLRSELENAKETLKIKEELLRHKAKQLELADQLITKTKDKKTELVDLVQKMEAQLERLRIRQIDSPIEVNDSQVSKCQALCDALQKSLAEEEKRIEKYARYGLTTTPEAPAVKEANNSSKADSIKAARAALADVAGEK